MMKNKGLTVEQGVEMIMAILGEDNGCEKIETVAGVGGAHVTKVTKAIKATKAPVIDMVYDGTGHCVKVGAKKVHVGPKKKRTVQNKKKVEMLDEVQVILNRVDEFFGKVGRNAQEGVVVIMKDADYTVKVMGHKKALFADRDSSFVPTKSFITRGQGENHSPLIAKALIEGFENEFSKSNSENKNQFSATLLEAKASGVRFEIENSNGLIEEITLKITKKRARVVIE